MEPVASSGTGLGIVYHALDGENMTIKMNNDLHWNGLIVSNKTDNQEAFEALERAWGRYKMLQDTTLFQDHIKELQNNNPSSPNNHFLTGLDIIGIDLHPDGINQQVTLQAKFVDCDVQHFEAFYEVHEKIHEHRPIYEGFVLYNWLDKPQSINTYTHADSVSLN